MRSIKPQTMEAVSATQQMRTSDAVEEEEPETVTSPLETDVLFGRDKIMFNHVGNVRFRIVIQNRAKEYEHAASRRVKSTIVYSVVQTVQSYGGRFLKKEKDGRWTVVTVTEAIQKVGHALRDKKQHDHKMKAKMQTNPGAPAVTAKNKSVEGCCDLLMKLGQVCAKEIDVKTPKQQEMALSPFPVPVSKRSLSDDIPEVPAKRSKGSSDDDCSAAGSDEDEAVNAILALTGKKRPTTADTPICTSAPSNPPDKREGWHQLGQFSNGHHEPSDNQTVASLASAAQMRSPHDALFAIRNQAHRIAHRHLTNQASGQMGPHRHSHMMPNGSPHLEAQLRALIQAQQMNNLIQAAVGVMPHRAGFKFADSPVAPPTLPVRGGSSESRPEVTSSIQVQRAQEAHAQRVQQAQEAQVQRAQTLLDREKGIKEAQLDEGSRSVTPPPVITDCKDDDGHWIFYPIKVPTLKLANIRGWKLALVPIDGKGKPVELDPSNIKFSSGT